MMAHLHNTTNPASSTPLQNIPQAPMKQMCALFRGKSGTDILRHALRVQEIPGAPSIDSRLIVNCIDLEWWSQAQGFLTELGIVHFSAELMRQVITNPGLHGDKFLEKMHYYLLRLKANAHLVNRRFKCKGNPDDSRFGLTYFVTEEEVRDLIAELFPPDSPVILMGHAIGNDIEKLSDTLGIDIAAFDNVVATIDTQQLAKEAGIKGHGSGPNDVIGLTPLMNSFRIHARDVHTALNDATYTMIGGVSMAVRASHYPVDWLENNSNLPSTPAQNMVSALEQKSRAMTPALSKGLRRWCEKCGQKGHVRRGCRVAVQCGICVKAGREKASHTHRDCNCTW